MTKKSIANKTKIGNKCLFLFVLYLQKYYTAVDEVDSQFLQELL